MIENNFCDYVKQLQKAIECSICLDELTNPVETRCGHTFCGGCLNTALSKKSVLPCPLCKYAIKKRGIKNATYLSKVVTSVRNLRKACISNLNLSGFPESSCFKNSQSNFCPKSSLQKQVCSHKKTVLNCNMSEDLNDFVDNTKQPFFKKTMCTQNNSKVNHEQLDDEDPFRFPISPCGQKNLNKNNSNDKQCTYRKAPKKSAKAKGIKLKKATKLKNRKEITLQNNEKSLDFQKNDQNLSSPQCRVVSTESDIEQQPDDKKQKAKEKVSNWLETVLPSAEIELDEQSCENCPIEDSDLDDLVSASQQLSPSSISKKNLPNVVNESILKALKWKNAELDAEVFGGKSKLQYKPKQAVKNFLHCASTSPKKQLLSTTMQKSKEKSLKKSRNKKSTKKNLFDINGLSQGVSPFSSPAKEEKSDVSHNSDNHFNSDSVETHIDALHSKSNRKNSLNPDSQHQLSEELPIVTAVATTDSVIKKRCSNNFDEESSTVSHSHEIDTNSLHRQMPQINNQKDEKLNCNSMALSQESKSTDSILDHQCNVTTVAAMIHNPPGQKSSKKSTKLDDFKFKTPVFDGTVCSKLTSNSVKRSCIRLEDMPIVCVGETQDEGEKLQSYYVETPGQSISSVLQKNPVKSPRKDALESVEDVIDKSTELGLLQFSPPSRHEVENSKDLQLPQATLSLQSPRVKCTKMNTNEQRQKMSQIDNVDDVSMMPVDEAEYKASVDDKAHLESSESTNTLAKLSQNVLLQNSPLALNKVVSLNDQPAIANKSHGDADESQNDANKSIDEASSLQTNLIQNTAQCCDDGIIFRPKMKVTSRPNTTKEKSEKIFNKTDLLDPESKLFEDPSKKNDLGVKDSQLYELSGKLTDCSQLGQVDLEKNALTPFFNEKSESLNRDKIHVFGTWPQTSLEETSIKPNSTLASHMEKHNLKEKTTPARDHEDDQKQESGDLMKSSSNTDSPADDGGVSSSPLLFAPSQSHTQALKKVDAAEQTVAYICCQCCNRSMVDKMVQCPDVLTETCETFSEMLELTNQLKILCKKLESCPSVSIKINELEQLLLHQSSAYSQENSSNESTIKPSSTRKKRVLSTSEDEVKCPRFEASKEDADGDYSDTEHFEIENSLPDMNPKLRSSNLRDRNRIRTKSRMESESSSSAKSTPCSSPKDSELNKSSSTKFSFKPLNKIKNIGDVSRSLNSTGSDVINATCKSKCRKRVLSSSDEDEISEKNSTKKARNDLLVDSLKSDNDRHEDSFGKQRVDIDKESAKIENLHYQIKNHDWQGEIAIEETPSITGSQVPSPTPPPQHPIDVVADTSGVQDILNSISKMTENENNRNRDCIEIMSSDDDKEKENRDPITQRITNNNDETLGDQLKSNMQDRSNSEQIKPSIPVSPSDLSVGDSFYSAGPKKFGVMVSGLRGKAVNLVRLFAKKWGGEFFENYVAGKVTHAVVRTQNMRCDRTLKFLQAVAGKAWVVSISWVTRSLKEKNLLPEDNYEVIGDNLDTSEELSFAPKRSRLSAADFKLLKGFAVYCIPSFALFTEAQFVELLRLCGARVCSRLEDLSLCPQNEQRIITVDPDAYSDALPNYTEMAEKFNATAVACSWALDCIGTFNLQPISNFPVEDFDSEMLSCE